MKKTFIKIFIAMSAIATVFYACNKEKEDDPGLEAEKLLAQACLQQSKGAVVSNASPYNVYLFSITDNNDGTYTWEWRVRNLTPGNGNPGTGTVQDLSHWGITLGNCVKPENIVSGATSTNGTTWNAFTPEFKVDPSQDCYAQSVIKFSLGTSGTNISYYRLTINKNVSHTSTVAIYKSGSNTGCGTLETCGFGCD